MLVVCFFFQAEDGIRDLVRSRGLGDVYKRQQQYWPGGRRGRTVAILACCAAMNGRGARILPLSSLSLIHI